MLRFIAVILFFQALLIPFTYAAPPVISKDVHVIPNATPAQCPSSLKTRVGSDEMTTYSGLGEQDDETAPGVRSCTSCAIDSQSGDCVCGTCYDYFDGF